MTAIILLCVGGSLALGLLSLVCGLCHVAHDADLAAGCDEASVRGSIVDRWA